MNLSCDDVPNAVFSLLELQEDYPGGIIQAVGELPTLNSNNSLDSNWLNSTLQKLFRNKVIPVLVTPNLGNLPQLPRRPVAPLPIASINAQYDSLGCWNDYGDRTLKNPGYVGDLPIDKCNQKASELNKSYFAMQAGRQCFIGSEPYDVYGKAGGDCPPNGAPWKSHVYKVDTEDDGSGYSDLGCWKDTWDRALKTNHGRRHTKDTCGQKAKELNHKYFSIQAGDECYSGDDKYDIHGRADGDCPAGGGGWKAHTWSTEVVPKTPTCRQYGRPSSDNSIRLYTKDECEKKLKGVYYPDGQCNKQDGGSWSTDCRALNYSSSVEFLSEEAKRYESDMLNYTKISKIINSMKKTYNDAVNKYNEINNKLKQDTKNEFCYYKRRLNNIKPSFLLSTSKDHIISNNKMVEYKHDIIQKLELKILILKNIASLINKKNIPLVEGFNSSMPASDALLRGEHDILDEKLKESKLTKRMIDYTIEKNKANQNLVTLFGVLNVIALGVIYNIATK
jgi:hypothetical protein